MLFVLLAFIRGGALTCATTFATHISGTCVEGQKFTIVVGNLPYANN